MTISRIALLAASVLVVACSSDEPTSAPSTPLIETKLAAAATVPTAAVSDPTVTMRVAVTSALAETVTGGVCAQEIEARGAGAATWTDVKSSGAVCSAQAAVLAPGATINITATGDQAKIRAVAGSGTSVVLRVRHLLTGASNSYTLQSNEVTWQLP